VFGKAVVLAFFVAVIGMLAAMPWNRIVVTIFRTAATNSATQTLGEVEVNRGGPAVDSKTNPSLKVAVPNVSARATQRSLTS
jgi:hypothetical protein